MQGSITPQTVAGVLKRAGFDASKRWATGVKGWHSKSAGFRTSFKWDDKSTIVVTYTSSSHHSKPEFEHSKLMQIHGALIGDGRFDVQIEHNERGLYQVLNVKYKQT